MFLCQGTLLITCWEGQIGKASGILKEVIQFNRNVVSINLNMKNNEYKASPAVVIVLSTSCCLKPCDGSLSSVSNECHRNKHRFSSPCKALKELAYGHTLSIVMCLLLPSQELFKKKVVFVHVENSGLH